MGLRNPFRIEFNKASGELYVADYSPDANAPNPLRGPAGHGKWTIVTKPGNYGWPYCATAKLPYIDYDFATGTSGAAFNCAAPGQRVAEQHRHPEPAAGDPARRLVLLRAVRRVPGTRHGRHRPDGRSGVPVRREGGQAGRDSTAWPAYYDGVPLFYEWTRDYIKAFFTVRR